MEKTERKEMKFDWKSFISFGLLFSFIIITVTGIALYIAPPGRVAKWIIWDFLGLEKTEWEAVHTIFSYIFVILGIFHTFSINWKAMFSYFKKKSKDGINRKKELVASLILIIAGYFGTIYEIQPFKAVMDLGEYASESWEKKEEAAPMPHTEAMTIIELSEKVVKLKPVQIIEKLKKSNIIVKDDKQTLDEIGRANKITPFEVYNLIVKNTEIKKTSSNSLKTGSGFGRKTLSDIAIILKTDIKTLIDKLKASGIEANKDDKIRDIADIARKSPLEIIDILKEGDEK